MKHAHTLFLAGIAILVTAVICLLSLRTAELERRLLAASKTDISIPKRRKPFHNKPIPIESTSYKPAQLEARFGNGWEGRDSSELAEALQRGVDVRLQIDGHPLVHPLPSGEQSVREVMDTLPGGGPALPRLGYTECASAYAKRQLRPRQELPYKLHWLHIPKSGTTLGVLLHSLMCTSEPTPHVSPQHPGEVCDYCGSSLKAINKDRWDQALWGLIDFGALPYCNWNHTTSTPRANLRNHVPLPLDTRAAQEWGVMALFRDPRARLVSGWNHDKHAMGIDGDRKKVLNERVQTVEEYVNSLLRARAARHRHIRSCATKMLVGAYCAASRNITAPMFEEALRRVHALAFVGLLEHWNATACLWCHQFGVEPMPHFFGAHARPGSLHRKPLPGGGDRVPSNYWRGRIYPGDDPLDWEVYTVASRLFYSRLQAFGLWQPNFKALERGVQPGPDDLRPVYKKKAKS